MPTCPGNSPDVGGAVCGAAINSCPRPGDTRVWVFTRLFDLAAQQYISDWAKTPGSICVGPEAPGLDPRIAVIATVRRDWKFFPLEKAVVTTRPTGASLVNAVTRATTTADGTDTIERTILGLPVVVHAVAQSYTWRFRDGTSLSVVASGQPPGEVTHTYARAGAAAVSLDIVYGGTFTVGGSAEVYDVQGTATVAGPATGLDVREARTQLEAGPKAD